MTSCAEGGTSHYWLQLQANTGQGEQSGGDEWTMTEGQAGCGVEDGGGSSMLHDQLESAGGVSPFDGIGKVAGATDLTCAAAVAAVAALTAKLPGSFRASSQLNYIRPLAQSTERGTRLFAVPGFLPTRSINTKLISPRPCQDDRPGCPLYPRGAPLGPAAVRWRPQLHWRARALHGMYMFALHTT